MSKITIRKVEVYTLWDATQPVDLEMEDFRNQDPPFQGESEEEFLEYINNYGSDIYSSSYSEDSTLSEESKKGLAEIVEGEKQVYADSRDKGGDAWLESGEVNEEFGRTGGFEAKHSTKEESSY